MTSKLDLIQGAAEAAELFGEDELERYAERQERAVREAAAEMDLSRALASISAWWAKTHPELPIPALIFDRVLEGWRMRAEDERVSKTLGALVERFYWACFHTGIGSKCHAFLEFNGVMSKYVELVRLAEAEGIDPQHINQHLPLALKVDNHHLEYLGEKLRCIFAPFIRDNPEGAEALRRSIFDGI